LTEQVTRKATADAAVDREFGAPHRRRRPDRPPNCELVGRLDQVVLGGSPGLGDSVGPANTKPM
jgi:hypothetical protein